MKKITFFVLVFCFFSSAVAGAVPREYMDAQDYLKNGDTDAAFMSYLLLSGAKRNTVYHQEAFFAVGEYYFYLDDYQDAFKTFQDFLETYPESKLRPFALFHLLKISRYWNQEKAVKSIEEEIINLKRIVLVFQENQELKLKSPLGKNYTATYYIDRVEFFVDGQIQEQILF